MLNTWLEVSGTPTWAAGSRSWVMRSRATSRGAEGFRPKVVSASMKMRRRSQLLSAYRRMAGETTKVNSTGAFAETVEPVGNQLGSKVVTVYSSTGATTV